MDPQRAPDVNGPAGRLRACYALLQAAAAGPNEPALWSAAEGEFMLVCGENRDGRVTQTIAVNCFVDRDSDTHQIIKAEIDAEGHYIHFQGVIAARHAGFSGDVEALLDRGLAVPVHPGSVRKPFASIDMVAITDKIAKGFAAMSGPNAPRLNGLQDGEVDEICRCLAGTKIVPNAVHAESVGATVSITGDGARIERSIADDTLSVTTIRMNSVHLVLCQKIDSSKIPSQRRIEIEVQIAKEGGESLHVNPFRLEIRAQYASGSIVFDRRLTSDINDEFQFVEVYRFLAACPLTEEISFEVVDLGEKIQDESYRRQRLEKLFAAIQISLGDARCGRLFGSDECTRALVVRTGDALDDIQIVLATHDSGERRCFPLFINSHGDLYNQSPVPDPAMPLALLAVVLGDCEPIDPDTRDSENIVALCSALCAEDCDVERTFLLERALRLSGPQGDFASKLPTAGSALPDREEIASLESLLVAPIQFLKDVPTSRRTAGDVEVQFEVAEDEFSEERYAVSLRARRISSGEVLNLDQLHLYAAGVSSAIRRSMAELGPRIGELLFREIIPNRLYVLHPGV